MSITSLLLHIASSELIERHGLVTLVSSALCCNLAAQLQLCFAVTKAARTVCNEPRTIPLRLPVDQFHWSLIVAS